MEVMGAPTGAVTLGAAHLPLRDQVREELRDRIADGRLPPGTKMVERELASELGVSRVPVREAVRMLETEGFVQVVPRRGVIVRHLSRRDVEELFDMREVLEVWAARRAATDATEAELSGMAAILDAGEAALPEGHIEAHHANESFHDALLAMAHHHLLAFILEPLQGRLHWLFRQSPDDVELAHDHRALFEAIKARDPDEAGRLALDHVRLNRGIALRLLFADNPQAT